MISQLIDNGKLVGNTTAATGSENGAAVKSSMNETKEMFLELLVAEMQYQDPLEPTDNTEYVKELATFSQVETLNNVQDDVNTLTSQNLVGKYVSLTDPDTGEVVEGKVDFVNENAGEQYVSVEGAMYKASTVTAVHDGDYFEAMTMAETFSSLVNQMPGAGSLTAADEEKWSVLNNVYAGMTDSQKKYISDETMQNFATINTRMNELMAQKAQEDTSAQEVAAAAQQVPVSDTQSTADTAYDADTSDDTSAALTETSGSDTQSSSEGTTETASGA